MDKNVKWIKEKKAEQISRVLLAKEYEAIVVNSLDEITTILEERVKSNETLVFGDSLVIEEMKLNKTFKEKGNYIYDYQNETCLEEKEEVRRKGLLADIYITEIDYVTENGELVLQGGFSNAATIYGPTKVYGILGVNKIVKNILEANNKIEETMEAYRCRELKSYDKELYNSFGTVNHGRKFPDKYTIFILTEDVGF